MKIRIWMYEAFTVFIILSAVVIYKRDLIEVIAALAVFFTFMHGQIADRHSQAESIADKPTVDCWRWSARYYLVKESLWVIYFVAHKSWSPLIGCALFIIYPFWRHYWNRRQK